MTPAAALLRAAALAAASTCAAAALAQAPPVSLRQVGSVGGIVEAVGREGRLFLAEQGGRVFDMDAQTGAMRPEPFLDLRGVVKVGADAGLLGLAFAPDHATSGHLFAFYSTPALVPVAKGHDLVLARFTRSGVGVDPASHVEVLRIPHHGDNNHNGGKIAFGPDGLLYIAVGDGGGTGGDPFDAGQNLRDLRGKLLRIDVRTLPYAIPPSNPFAGDGSGGTRPEIWAYGLRNPWRFSFDRATGELFIADVGQSAREEVNVVPAVSAGGHNFGWRVFEGTQCRDPAQGCGLSDHVPPAFEYGHANGDESITGGFVYRGRAVAELRGRYVFGDFVSGRVWALSRAGAGAWTAEPIAHVPMLTTFGEDEDGELYAVNASGPILRFAPVDADGDGMSDAFEARHFGGAGNPGDDADGDGLPNLHEYREGRDPFARDNDVFGDRRLFALQQYRDFLGREADAAGARFWAEGFAPGDPEQVRLAMIDRFFLSPEFQGLGAPVVRLYFAYLLRIPDHGGLLHWMGQARSGMSLDAISAQFAGSPEFTARYGVLSNAQFVDRVYRNVLGRAPDGEGLAYWSGRLDTADLTRGQLMLAFAESAEYRAAIDAEVYVTMAYVGMLRRTPEDAGFAHWVGALDAGRSRAELLGDFYRSAEYRSRFLD